MFLAWFLMLGSFPLGMFGTILLLLKFESSRLGNGPLVICEALNIIGRIPLCLAVTVGLVFIHTKSKINEDDTQHPVASLFFPCRR